MQKAHSTKTVKQSKKKQMKENKEVEQVNDSTKSEMVVTTITEKVSENVNVGIRIRPMNQFQLSRGDINCLKDDHESTLQINHKGVHKSYDFNYVMDANHTQEHVYNRCRVTSLINSAIEGYSATVFAYGQTGSGKTYSMAGKQQLFTKEVYKRDQREGIIPRAIHDLWTKVGAQKNKYSIKASYTEIYNQQIKDLLNPGSGILHCRWNPSNGFFVEDLIVVDCTDVDDMISVLNQGMKNRKSGSHEMNKDSSRSHSIMTLYIISESKLGNGSSTKKFGKIAFVDLAGSERLKQSKSQGEMIKETGNINKSLFTLGKVIKGLTDKKSKTPYIPYRDSKLTMLLMDSLGGNSKALMIACVSPSQTYFDETLSTLNYAARTMNITNKPIIQMDQKDQTIQQIQLQIEELRKQNLYLRDHYARVSKGLPLKIPQLSLNNMNQTFKTELGLKSQLPPLAKSGIKKENTFATSHKAPKGESDKIVAEYQFKFEHIKKQNQTIRAQKQESEEMYKKLMDANTSIQNKLDNLQQIFLSNKKDQESKDQIVTSGLLTENTELKKRLREMEKQKVALQLQSNKRRADNSVQLQEQNLIFQQEIQKLQQRERELLVELQRKK